MTEEYDNLIKARLEWENERKADDYAVSSDVLETLKRYKSALTEIYKLGNGAYSSRGYTLAAIAKRALEDL